MLKIEIILLVIVSIFAVFVFYLYIKSRKAHILMLKQQSKMNKEIEENQRTNYEMSLMLAEKMKETDEQARALQETSTELNWQAENALRLYDEIDEQKKEMTESIEYAKKIQFILLPEESLINEILNDYFILFQPRNIVSGDFYWINAKSTKTIVVVADCTGHGVPGAFMSLLGITFLNALVVRDDDIQADEILNQMRQQVIKSLRQTGKELENRDGMDMAMCIIDWENSRIEYAGANMSLFLLRSTPVSPHQLIEVKADRMPIGLFGTDLNEIEPFTRHIVPIMPGDSIYMFSDGYCDQFGGPDIKKYKIKNLKKVLSEIHMLNMSEQKKIIKQNLDDWKGDLPQIDDILMMGIKI